MKFFSLCLMMLFVIAVSAQNKMPKGDVFGEGVSSTEILSFDDLMSKLAKSDTVKATMQATVAEVCQMKGCWMTLVASEDQTDSDMMVRFKDYGFFMPKDISGREVVVEGKAYKTIVPVDELRHYAEDAGKSKEEIAKITEPQETYAFLASGVVLLKAQ